MVKVTATSTLLYQPQWTWVQTDKIHKTQQTSHNQQVYLALLKDTGHAILWYAQQQHSRCPVAPRHSHSEPGTRVPTRDKTVHVISVQRSHQFWAPLSFMPAGCVAPQACDRPLRILQGSCISSLSITHYSVTSFDNVRVQSIILNQAT